SSGIGDCRSHDASVSMFRGSLDVTEVIAPANPVCSGTSFGSKMGGCHSSHDSSPNRGSLSFCSKSRAHCRESFQSDTIMPLSNTEGVIMPSLGNALQELREDRSATQLRLEKLNQAISAIESLSGTGTTWETSRPKRVISAASRRKMALAQKARWAGIRKQSQSAGKTPSSAPAKRTMSASARKKIAAAQKARWAKIRAGKK